MFVAVSTSAAYASGADILCRRRKPGLMSTFVRKESTNLYLYLRGCFNDLLAITEKALALLLVACYGMGRGRRASLSRRLARGLPAASAEYCEGASGGDVRPEPDKRSFERRTFRGAVRM